jgi:hypothetical protein
VEQRVGRLAEQPGQLGHEAAGVGLAEVRLQGVVVLPLLDEHEPARLLRVLVDAVADAAVLGARGAAHLGGDLEEARSIGLGDLHAPCHDDHAAETTGPAGKTAESG